MTALTDYKIQTRVTLRYNDLDGLNHVNNANYLTFLESGRVDLLYDKVKKKWIEPPGTGFVLKAIKVVYDKAIEFPEYGFEVVVATRVTKIGNSSVTLEQAIFSLSDACATSESTIVLARGSESVPIPDELRKLLQERGCLP
jgi:acyl-CoA thioester hydrolase